MLNNRIDTETMHWNDINNASCYTENSTSNKKARTKGTPQILLGAIQFAGNYIKSLKQLCAYDSASIIRSDATWIQKCSFDTYLDKEKQEVKIEIGQVCYLDYGKTYDGELPYFHYGLCVGRKEGKLLFIPITSGKTWIHTCYHPKTNPKKSRKYRIAYKEEGFSKDCVLLINDAKYLSAGRITRLDKKIEDYDVLSSIQDQLFSVSFPNISNDYKNVISNNELLKSKIKDKNNTIRDLKHKISILELQLSSQPNS